MKNIAEKRKEKRYKANEGSYAAMGANKQIYGQIVDISLGGICFKYIDSLNNDQKSETEQTDLILFSGRGFLIRGLLGKTVDDYPIASQL